MKTLIIILISILMWSCATKPHVTQYRSDSLVYVETVKIDTLRIPAETLQFRVPFYQLVRDTMYTQRKGRIETKLVYTNGNLSVLSTCDSLERLVLSYQKTWLKTNKETRTEKPPDKSFTWWLAVGAAITVALYFIIKWLLNKF